MARVYFQESDLTIQIEQADGSYEYEIDCERLTDSAETLDFIFQIAEKGWATPEIMFGVLQAMNAACEHQFGSSVQGVFCSMGQDHEVNWRDKTSQTKSN
jgi:hypothetical protein